MRTLRARNKAVSSWLCGLLGLVLVLGGVAAGLHHHSDQDARRNCAVCVAAHAPALASAAIQAPAPPARAPEDIHPARAAEPRCAVRAVPSSRAPPLA